MKFLKGGKMDFTNKELDLLYRSLAIFRDVLYHKNSEYIQTMKTFFGTENIIDPIEDEMKEIENLLNRLFEKLR